MPKELNNYLSIDTTKATRPADTLKGISEALGYFSNSNVSLDSTNSVQKGYAGNFFQEHQLKVKNAMRELPVPSKINVSYLLVLLSLLVLVFIKNHGNQALLAYFKKTSPSSKKDKIQWSSKVDALNGLNALLVYTTFIYLASREIVFRIYPTLNDLKYIFLIIMPTLVVGFQLKKVIIALIGNIFKAHYLSQTLLYEENRFIRMSGILLLPFLLVAIMDYGWASQIAIQINLTIILLLYIKKILGWTLSSLRFINMLGIYFFLYFCTIEILPFAMLAKLLLKYW